MRVLIDFYRKTIKFAKEIMVNFSASKNVFQPSF